MKNRKCYSSLGTCEPLNFFIERRKLVTLSILFSSTDQELPTHYLRNVLPIFMIISIKREGMVDFKKYVAQQSGNTFKKVFIKIKNSFSD